MIHGIGSVNMWYVDLSTPGRYLQPRFKYNTFRFMWTYQYYDYRFLFKIHSKTIHSLRFHEVFISDLDALPVTNHLSYW